MEATSYELSPAEKARRESALEEARRQNALIAEAARRAKEADLAKTAMAAADAEVTVGVVPVELSGDMPSVADLGTPETPALVQAANMTANVSLDPPLRFVR